MIPMHTDDIEEIIREKLSGLKGTRNAMGLMMAILLCAFSVLVWLGYETIVNDKYDYISRIFPPISMSLLGILTWDVMKHFGGRGFPYFNFYRMNWVFRNPTVVVLEYTDEEALRGMQERLNEFNKAEFYPVRNVGVGYYNRDTRLIFLFKEPKTAMLFKLGV